MRILHRVATDLGLSEQSKGVVMPGVNEEEEERGRDDHGEFEERQHRAIAARANYLAQDWADVQLAAKRRSAGSRRSRSWRTRRKRKEIGEIPEGQSEGGVGAQVPEDAGEGCSVVRRGLCGVQKNKEEHLRRNDHVRRPLRQDLQQHAGHRCLVARGC